MSDYSSSLQLQVQPSSADKQYSLVIFKGNIDKAGLASVRDQLEEIAEKMETTTLVFDFTELSFINSEGIGFLLQLHTHLVRQKKRFVLVGANEHVKDVFDVIGLLKILDYYGSLADFEGTLHS